MNVEKENISLAVVYQKRVVEMSWLVGMWDEPTGPIHEV